MSVFTKVFVALLASTLACCAANPATNAALDSTNRDGKSAKLGRYHALVIGISEYKNFDILKSAAKDADDLASLLAGDYRYDVRPLPVGATANQVRDALDALEKDLSYYDNLLIYFSGHGKQGTDWSGGYWLAANAQDVSDAEVQNNPKLADDANWISREEIVRRVDRIQASHVVVVDDSCYSGKVAAPEAIAAPIPATSTRPLPTLVEIGPDAAAQLAAKRARVWLSASGARERAQAGAPDTNSTFSHHLLEVLRNNEGAVDGLDLFAAIRRQMGEARVPHVPEYQPLLRARHEGGDFLFFKASWDPQEEQLNLGRISVRLSRGTNESIRKLVLGQLRDIDELGEVVQVDKRSRPLLLSVAYASNDELNMTLVDRETNQVLARVTQALSADSEELGATVRAGVTNLRAQAVDALRSKEISVAVVKRAMVAQSTQVVEGYFVGGAAAYLDFDGDGMLNRPALNLELGANGNLTRWLLLGPVFGFNATWTESDSPSFIGDIDDGTYAHNRLVGETDMKSYSAMLRVTIRQAHGLIRPFGYLAGGIAHVRVDLGDERFVPATREDTLAVNLENRRAGDGDWGPAWGFGGGASLQATEWLSVILQGSFFKPHHEIEVESELAGVNESQPVVTKFQSVQTAAIEAGVGLHW